MRANVGVVTPCFNAGRFLARTFDSVLSQASPKVNVTYVVVDGGSKDDTRVIVDGYRAKFTAAGIEFRFISEPDQGMYDAIRKGFFCLEELGACDVYCYINAGDWYAPRAFANVAVAIERGVNWVTSINFLYNTVGDVISTRVPGIYPSALIRAGAFGRILPCIQQECTFWSRRAHMKVDWQKISNYRLAGDFFIWKSLADNFDLKVLLAWTGGFTKEPGQLSEVHRAKYFKELRQLSSGWYPWIVGAAIVVGLLWCLPTNLAQKMFAARYLHIKSDSI